MSQCYFKGFLHHVARHETADMLVIDLIQHHIEQHCKRQLYTNPDTAKLVDMCCQRLQLEHSVLNVTCGDITSRHLHSYIGLRPPACNTTEDLEDSNMHYVSDIIPHLPALDEGQAAIFSSLTCANVSGYHFLTGPPGTGKTLVIKHIINELVLQGKKVCVAATTGAAANRIAEKAATVHSLFALNPAMMYLTPLMPNHEMYAVLRNADYLILDEVSMLTSTMLNCIHHRLSAISSTRGDSAPPFPPVLLVGDMLQLPPVCHCKLSTTDGPICKACHISASPVASSFQLHELSTPHRCTDPEYLGFLQHIRTLPPTDPMLSATLQHRVVSDVDRDEGVLNASTVLCSHVEDTLTYNRRCLISGFCADDIVRVSCNTNVDDGSPLQEWRDNIVTNQCIAEIAVNAKVIVTANVKHMARNGDMGRVVAYKMFANKPEVCRIDVLVERTQKTITFRRSTYYYRAHMGEKFHVATFPLLLGYAITVHRAQGLSLPGPVLIDLRNGFAPGLAYVAFSRVTDPNLLRVTARTVDKRNFVPCVDFLRQVMHMN